MARATAAHVRQWRERGWVLIPGLVPTAAIDAALEDLWRLYPRPEEYAAGAGGTRRRAFDAGADERALFRSEGVGDAVGADGAAAGPAFRPEQFLGRRQFPFPGSGALNRLAVHDALLDFAERALGSTDLRLYQLGVWGKYTGVADYEQPMHQDHNHAVVPPRAEPGWWHVEGSCT